MARVDIEPDGYTQVTPLEVVSYLAACPACGELATWLDTLWHFSKRRIGLRGYVFNGPSHESVETVIHCKCEADND